MRFYDVVCVFMMYFVFLWCNLWCVMCFMCSGKRFERIKSDMKTVGVSGPQGRVFSVQVEHGKHIIKHITHHKSHHKTLKKDHESRVYIGVYAVMFPQKALKLFHDRMQKKKTFQIKEFDDVLEPIQVIYDLFWCFYDVIWCFYDAIWCFMIFLWCYLRFLGNGTCLVSEGDAYANRIGFITAEIWLDNISHKRYTYILHKCRDINVIKTHKCHF